MIIEARVSDNVLDDDDYTVVRLTIEGGVVVKREEVVDGVYDLNRVSALSVGATVAQIEAWTRYDSTGHHPETYHEVREPAGSWSTFAKIDGGART